MSRLIVGVGHGVMFMASQAGLQPAARYVEQSLDNSQVEEAALTMDAVAASDLMKALAHEGRLVILCLLAERERSVTELESMLDLRQPAVSQQLARLRADDLVNTRREGKLIYYSLASERARRIVQTLIDVYRPS